MNIEPVVFIVDDDVDFGESLSMLVSSMGLMTKTFASPVEYLEKFDPAAPGVLLLDLRMPAMSGLLLQEKLNSLPICPSIVFLTGHAEIPPAIRAIRQGAVDFLQKNASESELYDAIQRGISQDADRRSVYRKKCELSRRLSRLNEAEKQVLEQVLSGVPNKQIASLLGVSRRTVEDRRARIMQKLGAESLAALVRLAVEGDFPQTRNSTWE